MTALHYMWYVIFRQSNKRRRGPFRGLSFSYRPAHFSWRLSFQQQGLRVFDEFLYAHKELHGIGAVHDAVIVGEGEVHHRAYLDPAVYGDGAILDLMQAQDRHLRDVKYGRGVERTEDAAVGYGEGAALQFLEAKLAVAGPLAELSYGALDLGETLPVGVAHDRDDEPLLSVDRHAYVVVVLEDELGLLKLGVDLGERFEGPYRRLGEEGHKAEPGPIMPLLKLLLAAAPQLHHGAHVRLVEGGEHRRRLLGLDEPARDGLAPAREPDAFLQSRAAVFGGRGRCLLLAVPLGLPLGGLGLLAAPAVLIPDQSLHVVLGHATAAARARHLCKVYTVLPGEPPDCRRGPASSIFAVSIGLVELGLLGFGLLGLRGDLLFPPLGLFGLGLFGLLLLCLYLRGGAVSGAFAYGAYHVAHADVLALAHGYALQHAVLLGLDLEVDLVGLELDDRLAGCYLVPFVLKPLPDRRFGNRLPKLRDVNLNRHVPPRVL